jgi:hypothetical protein
MIAERLGEAEMADGSQTHNFLSANMTLVINDGVPEIAITAPRDRGLEIRYVSRLAGALGVRAIHPSGRLLQDAKDLGWRDPEGRTSVLTGCRPAPA